MLHYAPGPVPNADANLILAKSTLDQIHLKQTTVDEAIASGDLKVEGNRGAFDDFLGLLDT
jgi:alkyl sulfatase BDS1-like metallo-beta-lactamase superfamily hydrolase